MSAAFRLAIQTMGQRGGTEIGAGAGTVAVDELSVGIEDGAAVALVSENQVRVAISRVALIAEQAAALAVEVEE